MDFERDILISTINKTITEIKKVRDELKENKAQIDKVKGLRARLFELERALGPRRDWYAEKLSSLDELMSELSVFKFKVISSSVDEMFNSIEKNLIDGMSFSRVSNEKGDLYADNKKVGSVEVIREPEHVLKIKVEVLGSSDDFQVDDPNKMYSIISFINTKYNYYSTADQN